MLRYKVGFAIYWLLFAVLSTSAAKDPGYVRHPELVPFPILGLIALWVLLAATTAAFYFILRPPLFRASTWRLPTAVALCITLLLLSFRYAGYTDQPGLYYIPFYYSCVTMLVLVVVAISTTFQALLRRVRSAP